MLPDDFDVDVMSFYESSNYTDYSMGSSTISPVIN